MPLRIEHIRTYLACVNALGEKKWHILDIVFIGVHINLIRCTAVRSQRLYPKELKKAKFKDEVIGSVKLKNTPKSRTQKERIK